MIAFKMPSVMIGDDDPEIIDLTEKKIAWNIQLRLAGIKNKAGIFS